MVCASRLRVASNSFVEFEIQKNELQNVLATTDDRIKRRIRGKGAMLCGKILSFREENKELWSEPLNWKHVFIDEKLLFTGQKEILL